MKTQQAGMLAESLAREYLVEHGLIWRASNYRCRLGEIDLVMEDGKHLVFVEVRARRSAAFGGALASVTRTKQQKLIKTAWIYLIQHKLHATHACRFDVLSLDGDPPQMQWIKNAFGTD